MATTVPNNPFDTTQSSTSGIVSQAMDNSVSQITPETRSIDPATQTVSGQVDSMLSKDSPLLQRARTLATQGMAQRGLVNSSMSQGAGTAAMIDRVTPIAAQDANTYNAVASENMSAKNNAGMFNAGEKNKFSLQSNNNQFTAQLEGARQNFASAQAELDRAQQTAMADKSVKAQQDLQTAQQNFTSAQTALDRTQQTSLQTSQQKFQDYMAGLDRNQQTAMQTSQQNFTAEQQRLQNQFAADTQRVAIAAQNAQIPASFASTITNTTMSGVNAIIADGNLSAAAKQTAVNNLITYANSQISWANKFYGTQVPGITGPALA